MRENISFIESFDIDIASYGVERVCCVYSSRSFCFIYIESFLKEMLM